MILGHSRDTGGNGEGGDGGREERKRKERKREKMTTNNVPSQMESKD